MSFLQHSAKGSSWDDHKYIKRVNGTYYYPDSYKGGRHLSKGVDGNSDHSSKHSEYTDGDHDFDDKNYSDKNRLGNTDFYGFKREDGTYVILEEDMKWELPKGTKITPELISRLEAFDRNVTQMRGEGKDEYINKNWERLAKEAIDGDESNSSSGGKLSSKDIEQLAKEVIRGNFGNGNQRKELLGDDYKDIQNKVNEILKKGSVRHDGLRDGSDTIEHHGRLHQKWGVLNGPPYPLGASATRGYASKQEHRRATGPHEDHQKAHNKGEHHKDISEMSDAELQKRLNRLRMEQQYSDVSDTEVNRGKKKIDDVLKVIGTTAATTSAILTIYNNANKIAAICGRNC